MLRRAPLRDLVVANPDLAVHHEERHHVVHERLALRVAQRHGEHLLEQRLDQSQLGSRVEVLVEEEQRSGAHEAVARHLQLLRRVDYSMSVVG